MLPYSCYGRTQNAQNETQTPALKDVCLLIIAYVHMEQIQKRRTKIKKQLFHILKGSNGRETQIHRIPLRNKGSGLWLTVKRDRSGAEVP